MSDKKEKGLKVVDDENVVEDTGKHADIREKVLKLRQDVEDSSWKLSQAMYGIYKESLYLDWGFTTWADYIEGELDFEIRKAQYLIAIQDWFSKMQPSVQNWIKGLGWSKAKELVGIVNNDNAAEWQKKIEGKSVKGIIDLIKGNKEPGETDGDDNDGDDGGGKGEDSEEFTKVTFNLAADQYKNWLACRDALAEVAESDKDGHLFDLMSTSYMAQNVGINSVQDYLANSERLVGLSLIAYSEKKEAVVYGEDTLDKIIEGEVETETEEE